MTKKLDKLFTKLMLCFGGAVTLYMFFEAGWDARRHAYNQMAFEFIIGSFFVLWTTLVAAKMFEDWKADLHYKLDKVLDKLIDSMDKAIDAIDNFETQAELLPKKRITRQRKVTTTPTIKPQKPTNRKK